MDIESLEFFDFYGGPAKLTVQEYLAAQAGDNTDDDDNDEDENAKIVLAWCFRQFSETTIDLFESQSFWLSFDKVALTVLLLN